jgi:hypothetical protein
MSCERLINMRIKEKGRLVEEEQAGHGGAGGNIKKRRIWGGREREREKAEKISREQRAESREQRAESMGSKHATNVDGHTR